MLSMQNRNTQAMQILQNIVASPIKPFGLFSAARPNYELQLAEQLQRMSLIQITSLLQQFLEKGDFRSSNDITWKGLKISGSTILGIALILAALKEMQELSQRYQINPVIQFLSSVVLIAFGMLVASRGMQAVDSLKATETAFLMLRLAKQLATHKIPYTAQDLYALTQNTAKPLLIRKPVEALTKTELESHLETVREEKQDVRRLIW